MNVELPPMELTEEDRSSTIAWEKDVVENSVDNAVPVSWLACRERQLLASIAENRQKDAEVERLQDRVRFDRCDNSHPATHCLRLLVDFNISVGKACEFLSNYFLTGKLDPIAEQIREYDALLDEIPASDIARRMRKAEVELAELRSLGGERPEDVKVLKILLAMYRMQHRYDAGCEGDETCAACDQTDKILPDPPTREKE